MDKKQYRVTIQWSLALLLILLLFNLNRNIYASELTPPVKAPQVDFISQGQSHTLSEYQGKKTMLWLFSTWCHTCAAGVKALTDKQSEWERNGLVILALRNYKNGGYPGPNVEEFISHYSSSSSNNWVKGEASEVMNEQFNSRQYPDIYFLIDEQGIIQEKGTAPAVFIQKIIDFAQSKTIKVKEKSK